MSAQNKNAITIKTEIDAPVEKVWEYWTRPEHIIKWNNASDDWHTPKAENDFREGGRFTSRMEARDGSVGFDFGGTNNVIKQHEYIEYTLDDDRKVKITFNAHGNTTHVTEIFEAEETNSLELQEKGWQSILDNFKKYAEEKSSA
ncbi:MAG: SRPBCC family protein [Ginsengibacter sp.]